MHPEIKKFWKDAGYSIESEPGYITDPGGNRIQLGTITAYKKTDLKFAVSKIETIAFGDQHRFNGEWYSEEEMLRIIKLKAFF